MKRLQTPSLPDITLASLSYELNSIALTVAVEAEKLAAINPYTNCMQDVGSFAVVGKIHGLIEQLREVALILRYVRHSGHLPPQRDHVI